MTFDNLKLEKLECPYFDICSYYTPEKCYNKDPCKFKINGIKIKSLFKQITENYVAFENIKFQLDLLKEK